MINNNNHIIDLNITLTSQLYQAYPDNAVALNPKFPNNKTSLTTKKPLIVGGDTYKIPCVPSNGFRGGLRRKAAARVMGQLVTEARVSSQLYLGLTCGAGGGSPDQTALSIEELLRARRNVYMGVFGAGARIIPSSYRVSDLNPVLDITVKAGMVPKYCKDIVQPRRAKENDDQPNYIADWQLTTGILSLIRVDDVARVMRPDEIMFYMANPLESVTSHQEGISGNKEDRKEGTAIKEDVGNIMAFETITTGTPMHLRITLDNNITEGQLGLMLYSLSDLIRENSLGGMGSKDLGRYRVDAFKLQLGDSLGGGVVTGLDLGQGAEFGLPADSTIERLLKAADQGLSELTIADMQSYFTDFSAAAKAEAKKDKKAKKAAA